MLAHGRKGRRALHIFPFVNTHFAPSLPVFNRGRKKCDDAKDCAASGLQYTDRFPEHEHHGRDFPGGHLDGLWRASSTRLPYDQRMSRFGTQYQVSSPTGVCAATGQPLEPGVVCMACLCEREDDEGFDRQDFSMAAWDEGTRPERLFSFWKTTVSPPEEKRKLLVDDEVLIDLFHRLAGDERPQRIAFRFVLALILMRKKRLKFAGRTDGGEGGTEHWLLRRPGQDPDEPLIEVANPRLSDDDVRELTGQLGEILQGEL